MTLPAHLILPTEAELASYKIVAYVAAQNPYWRKIGGSGKAEEVISTILSVMLLGRELGISPIQCISGGINNIQGKFEISARLMNQLIRRHGHKLKIVESTHEVCSIWSQRKDTGEELTQTYDIEEASRAGLIKEGGGWKKCPKDMLFARAISRLARQLYPDCIGGAYVEGELQETILKQSAECPAIPSKEEVELEEVQCEVSPSITFTIDNLILPLEIDRTHLGYFITETALKCKKPESYVIEHASKRLDSFLSTFKEWETKNFSSDKKQSLVVFSPPS